MKNALLAISLILGLAATTQANAIPNTGTVVFANTIYDGNYGGGEFEANVAGYDSIYTFCVEYNERIRMNREYNYSLNDRATMGGSGSPTSGYDILSLGTSHLYTLFFQGLLYDRTLDSDHDTNAGYLQAAFWALENEKSFAWAGGLSNPYLHMVVNEFGSFANAQADYDPNTSGVRVMNLTYTRRGNLRNAQDQLVYINVPDGGLTIALLGAAFVGLTAVRRRTLKT